LRLLTLFFRREQLHLLFYLIKTQDFFVLPFFFAISLRGKNSTHQTKINKGVAAEKFQFAAASADDTRIRRGSVWLEKNKTASTHNVHARAARQLQIGKVLHHQGGGVAKCPLF
jgi:hypothetical protein